MAMVKKNKKSYNFTMSTTTKQKLDEMALTDDCSRNELIEQLINLEYLKRSK
ncbi:hypothetical protein [Vibrio algarum]|uniref:Ribbon-helix-helix protein, CopG family n=1 Tax=Vibrio algarum TaxID=3020714 RepID=A0ABT4YLD5_9VIBR|nr:hypothetical protein [Vibrio sp. KJ40-1]MDB1122245.1 hypothetical protein [Vibrio sp. KJ40-1]